jgi:cysteine synthase/O-phosphoserine sulfhydrylase/cystathionine beta-synthase
MADILRKGVVKPLRVEKGVVANEEDRRLYWALRVLGVRRVPVGGDELVELEELGFYDDVNPSPLHVYYSTLELLYRGWPTPLVKLHSLGGNGRRVWAKLEWYNPFSMSVKDRIGWYMVVKAFEEGWQGKLIYEATSTNTGMALASMASIHGFHVRLYLPKTIQKASDILLAALGAEVVRKEGQLTVELIDEVRRDAEEAGAYHINQFENDFNFMVHLRYTAKELDLQLRYAGVRPKAIIGGLGTSGHMAAISFYFKNRYGGSIRIYGVEPAPGETIPGIRRIETGMKWIHWVEVDGVVDVTRDEAIEALLHVARRDGILPGLSSGAVAAAYIKLVERGELEPGDYVVVFPDNGFKYVEQLQDYFKRKGLLKT